MGKIITLLCLLLFAGLVLGRAVDDWILLQEAYPVDMVDLRFALKQQNLGELERTLLDVSNPTSANYGKWWSTEQILDLVAPSASVSDQVASFLSNHGAKNVENHRDMIKCSMSVSDTEKLLSTNLFEYEHLNGLKVIIRTTEAYTIPAEIAPHVALVAGISEFPQVREPKIAPKDGVNAPAKGIISVQHLQQLYNIPATFTNNKESSLALAEFEDDQSFDWGDLTNFVKGNAIPNITVDHTVGPFNDSSPDAESTLDVQYGGAIAISSSVWFWTVDGWMYEFATDLVAANPFPLVVSMSWGWPEPLQCQIDPNGCSTNTSFAYVDRVNVEFQKIGLRGITLIAASGDQGAPGDGDSDCSNTTAPLSTIFPGASPWVLSVGATMLESDVAAEKFTANPPVCSQYSCATSTKEGVCTYPGALITTGGGFSNVSPRPSWQDTVVTAYLNSGVKFPDDQYYNKSNRGFPDVSALGHNYLIALGGDWEQVDGTSASTPVWGGIITLLNSARLNANKAPLGFVIPALYGAYAQDPTTYTDITSGNNYCTEQCCGKIGYVATKGWDAVTGLGTPQFPALEKYVLSLP